MKSLQGHHSGRKSADLGSITLKWSQRSPSASICVLPRALPPSVPDLVLTKRIWQQSQMSLPRLGYKQTPSFTRVLHKSPGCFDEVAVMPGGPMAQELKGDFIRQPARNSVQLPRKKRILPASTEWTWKTVLPQSTLRWPQPWLAVTTALDSILKQRYLQAMLSFLTYRNKQLECPAYIFLIFKADLFF